MTDRYVDYVPLDQVKLAARNPKGHNGNGIRTSIDHFGFAELPLIDERTGRLVAGHGRHEQLLAMAASGTAPPDGIRLNEDGTWTMPVIRGWASRSDAEAEAYLIGSNQLTVAGGWDNAGLTGLLRELADQDLLELTGFTIEDLDTLLAEPPAEELPPAALTDPDALPEPPPDPVTKPGDMWLLGPHRVLCGDCRDHGTLGLLVGESQVNVAFTSPPYASQRKYDETSGFRPIPPDEYVGWFEKVQANVRAVLAEDGSWFVNVKEHAAGGQRHLYVKDLIIAHVRRWAWLWVDELCWVDTHNGVPGGWPNRFKDAWEPVHHFSTTTAIKFNPMANGTDTERAIDYSPTRPKSRTGSGLLSAHGTEHKGRARPSNVLQIPAAAGEASGLSSAPFPVELPAWFIRAYSDQGDVVLDPFMGSGTTLMAAHQEQRVAYGVEISPAYCDVICRRWQEHTGVVPVLASTGEDHDFTANAAGLPSAKTGRGPAGGVKGQSQQGQESVR